jgi:hypothetical protein
VFQSIGSKHVNVPKQLLSLDSIMQCTCFLSLEVSGGVIYRHIHRLTLPSEAVHDGLL